MFFSPCISGLFETSASVACVLSLPSTDDKSREELSLLELAVSGTFVVCSETKSKNHKKALYKLALRK